MARISGIDLPDSQRIEYSLTLLYGIGWKLSREILEKTKIDMNTRTRDLTEEEMGRLSKALEEYTTEGDLRREVRQNIQRLRDINSYMGSRHSHNLPVHGQRTRTNARTRRGKRKTVGAFKKEALAKQTTAATKK
jgi:small subunit ribosomal protein S13